MTEQPKSIEQRKTDAKDGLGSLEIMHPSFGSQIRELVFYINQNKLGNGQAYYLEINEIAFAVGADDGDESVLGAVETFLCALSGVEEGQEADTQATETTVQVKDTAEPLVPEKEKTYWRDVNIPIILVGNAFEDRALGKEMKDLRKIIHKGDLGTEDFSIKDGDIELNIKAGESGEVLLLKLSKFVKQLQRKYEKELESFIAKPREWIDDAEDRQAIWSVILSQLVVFKNKFRGSNFGASIAELKDLIDGYQLGYKTGFEINEKWGKLSIEKGDDLNTIVKKLVDFIEKTQKANTKVFEKSELISATDAYASREEDKVYWRDIVAGLDTIQSQYPEDQYPAINTLKELIENDELAQGGRLILSVGLVTLNISPKEKDKVIKNKISCFIGELKQVAPEGMGEVLGDVYWRDIEASLKSMEDAYGDHPDYQLLMMTIEMGTFATVKDFHTIIDGVSLDVDMTDSDNDLKQKLDDFVKELKTISTIKIDQKAFDKAKKRIEDLEKNMLEIEAKYQEELDEKEIIIDKVRGYASQKNREVDELKDELKRYKQQVSQSQPTPVRTRSYSG